MPVGRGAGARARGRVKPVGKERLILSVGFKSFLFGQVHSGCCLEGGSVRNRESRTGTAGGCAGQAR